MKTLYRPGGVGAIMDEYERAARELVDLVSGLSNQDFERVRDEKTKDEECRSIMSVANHVVRSGYAYANYIRGALSMPTHSTEAVIHLPADVASKIRTMLDYTIATLEGRWEATDAEVVAVQMKTRWGQTYDLEQLLEHAVVHVLRHRRQVERFLVMEVR